MKKFIAIASILLFTVANTMAGDAPAKVKQAFIKKFKGASKVKWEKENSKEYEANFEMNGKKMSANFSLDGSWLETESEISISELPANIKAAIEKEYPKATLKGADRIETAKDGLRYEADIKTGLITKEVLLDAKGNFIK